MPLDGSSGQESQDYLLTEVHTYGSLGVSQGVWYTLRNSFTLDIRVCLRVSSLRESFAISYKCITRDDTCDQWDFSRVHVFLGNFVTSIKSNLINGL
jgi:hypothetical protein